MNSAVDFYFNKAEKWQKELELLRTISLDCPLTEELKWGVPCYTFQRSNVMLLHAFKNYCAVLFVKGALLNNTDGILIAQTENTTAPRQIRFTSVHEILEKQTALKRHIYEAIEVEKAGLKVEPRKTTEFTVPDEFKHKLAENPALKTAFDALTPGRKRAYFLHFAAPKQAKTRESRIEKCMPQILNGKGLDD
jgi:uncharacterized protein YdeI (YjbR/CyaY-like superfamily)